MGIPSRRPGGSQIHDGGKQPPQQPAGCQGPATLNYHITRNRLPLKATGGRQGHRHRRIEMGPAGFTEPVDEHHHHRSKRECDARVGDRPMRDLIGHDGSGAREHDEERAQKLRQPWSPGQRSGCAVFLAHAPPFRSRDFSDRDPNDRDSIDRHCDPTQHWSASSRKARRRSRRA